MARLPSFVAVPPLGSPGNAAAPRSFRCQPGRAQGAGRRWPAIAESKQRVVRGEKIFAATVSERLGHLAQHELLDLACARFGNLGKDDAAWAFVTGKPGAAMRHDLRF